MHEAPGSWLKPLVDAMPEAWQGYVDLYVVNSWLIIVILVVLAWAGTRRRERVPGGLQNVWEWYVEWVRGFCRDQIGEGGEKYAPLLGTLFLYILSLNLFGLVPGFITPTESLNMTAALALCVFLAVQYYGFADQGVGYLQHFIGQPLGEDLAMKLVYVLMAPIMLVVHIIGELAKPLSLAVRLFGNMFGEETAISRMAMLSAAMLPFLHGIPIPVQIINVLLHLIIGPIQAFIFFILSAAYIETATSAHEHDAHGEHGHEEAPQQAQAA
ncbi:MAG: F0F1 ATP synthase subunit A [Armatimonadota bacterium]|nr:F0F1 ATP synthase subunit A [Armatimonadota bacterium]